MPIRLDFTIAHCTSWDPSHPPSELLLPPSTSPRTIRGYQTPSDATYPQTIVLKLEQGPAKLEKLQILSHHSKIPSEIEVFVGVEVKRGKAAGTRYSRWERDEFVLSDPEEGEEDDTLIDFTRLGIVTLSQNPSHRSRELKTVPIPHPRPQVTHIRFDILGCHSNHLNRYNQAGIVAVSVFGEPVRSILPGESVMVGLDDWEASPVQTDTDLEASFMIDSNTLVNSLLAYEGGTAASLPKNIHSKHHHPMNRSNSGHHQSIYSSSPRFVEYHDDIDDDNDMLLGRSPSSYNHDMENLRRYRAGLVSSAAVTKESEIRVLQAALACAKDAANEQEDFRLALTFKTLISHLSRVADDLARLEQAKRVAVQAEEFEMAAKLKREVDSMRAAVDRMLAEEGIRIAEDGVVEIVEPIPKQSLSHQSRRSQSPSTSNLLFSPRSRSLIRTPSRDATRHRNSSRDSLPPGSLPTYPVFLMPNRSTPSPSSHGSPRQTSLQRRPSPGGTPSVRTPQRSSSTHITPASSHVGSVVGSPRRRSVSRSASHSTHSTTAAATSFIAHENINEEADREVEEENSQMFIENNLDNHVSVENHQDSNDQQVEQEIEQEIEQKIEPEIEPEVEPEVEQEIVPKTEVMVTSEPYPVTSLSASSIVDHPNPNNNHLSTRSNDSEMGTTSPFSEAVMVSTPEPGSPQSNGSAEFTELHPSSPPTAPKLPTPSRSTDALVVPPSEIVSAVPHDVTSQTPEPHEVLLSELAPAAPSSLIVMQNTDTPFRSSYLDDRPLPKPQKFSNNDPEAWDTLEESPSTDPLGSRGPEPLTEDQCTEFEQEVYVFGERVVACALSRRFRLREWALARVTDRIEGLPILENEGPGTNITLGTEDLEVDGLGLITRKREFLPPHPEVEGIPLVKAALTMTELGLRESRERLVALALTLWESLVSYCAVQRLPPQHYFRHFELVLPVLINKVNDINPRIRAGSVELLLHLCKSFKTPPYTILPHIICKPKRLITNYKQARSRVELARKIVEEMGLVSARQERETGGLSLEAVMDFAAAYLQHQHVEVRDAAVKLGVEVCRIVGVEVVENGLKGIKPGLVENIKKMAIDAGPSPQSQLRKTPPSANTKSSVTTTPAATSTKKTTKSKISTSGTITPDTPSPSATKRKPKSPPEPLNLSEPAASSASRAKSELQQATPPTPTSANSQPKGETITLLEMQLAELRAMVVQAGIPHNAPDAESPTRSSHDEADATPKKPAAKVVKKTKTPASAPSKVGVRTRKKTGEEEGTKTPPPKGVTARRRSSTDPPAPKTRSNLSNGTGSTPTRQPRRASDSSQDLPSSQSVRTNPSIPRTTRPTKSGSNGSKPPTKPSTPRPASPARTEKTCIFCDVQDESFNEDTLVVHYWNDCPILTNCPLCNIILEISTLTDHVVQDCDQRSIIRQCQRCREIIPVKDWLQHTLRPSCTMAPADIVRCPLCHLVIEPGNEIGWKQHLLDGEGCPHNPRKKGVNPHTKSVKAPAPRKVETPTELAPRAPSSASNSSNTRIPKSGNLPVAGIPVARARRVITN